MSGSAADANKELVRSLYERVLDEGDLVGSITTRFAADSCLA